MNKGIMEIIILLVVLWLIFRKKSCPQTSSIGGITPFVAGGLQRYKIGDIVSYEDRIYQCGTASNDVGCNSDDVPGAAYPGIWDSWQYDTAAFSSVIQVSTMSAPAEITPFVAGGLQRYKIGDIVSYEDRIYQCGTASNDVGCNSDDVPGAAYPGIWDSWQYDTAAFSSVIQVSTMSAPAEFTPFVKDGLQGYEIGDIVSYEDGIYQCGPDSNEILPHGCNNDVPGVNAGRPTIWNSWQYDTAAFSSVIKVSLMSAPAEITPFVRDGMQGYEIGDIVSYEDGIYQCGESLASNGIGCNSGDVPGVDAAYPGIWDSWQYDTAAFSSVIAGSKMFNPIIARFVDYGGYAKDDIVTYNHRLYKCNHNDCGLYAPECSPGGVGKWSSWIVEGSVSSFITPLAGNDPNCIGTDV